MIVHVVVYGGPMGRGGEGVVTSILVIHGHNVVATLEQLTEHRGGGHS